MNHKGTQRLETARLYLRPFTLTDAAAMYKNWASDPEVTKYLRWQAHESVATSEAILREWAASYADKTSYQWAIVPKNHDDRPIGSINVVSQNEAVSMMHIGYCIGRAWWHQGIMTEALGAVMDFLFDVVGAERIESQHDPRNPHSGAVMRKCGMKYEGTLRASDRNNQGICDAAYYALLKSER